MTRSLGETDASRHYGVKDEIPKMISDFFRDLLRKPGAAVGHREKESGDHQTLVQSPTHKLDRTQELRKTLKSVVLALHRNEHPVRSGERIHRERTERRRTIDEDEGIQLTGVSDRANEKLLTPRITRQLDHRPRQLGL